MLELTMNWKDDHTNVTIQQKEADFTEDTPLCYSDATDTACTAAADTFRNILIAAGYSQQTIAKYMVDAGLSLMFNTASPAEFNDYMNQIYRDWED